MTATARVIEAARVPPPRRVLMKGNVALAEAAIAAGCDAYFGYPITPQTELLERMALRMPQEGRAFVQAESELGAIAMALGAAAAGARVMVSTASPGFSLMAETMSYLAASRLPVVVIDVMRGGPGLGGIGPAQSDYLQATRGHGHGDYHVPVLAPGSIPEAAELIAVAFEIAERHRTPVILLTDGALGQAMEPVVPSFRAVPHAIPGWALTGADGRPPRVVSSLHLHPEDLEAHNAVLAATAARIATEEVRWEADGTDGAELLVVAYGTAARIARSAVDALRADGLHVGRFRPITLWPFPADALRAAARGTAGVLVVELSLGQMVDDVRLALGDHVPIAFHGRTGGMLPTPAEVAAAIRALDRASSAGVDDGWGADPLALLTDGAGRTGR